jgi:hypothetical protein
MYAFTQAITERQGAVPAGSLPARQLVPGAECRLTPRLNRMSIFHIG